MVFHVSTTAIETTLTAFDRNSSQYQQLCHGHNLKPCLYENLKQCTLLELKKEGHLKKIQPIMFIGTLHIYDTLKGNIQVTHCYY